MNRSNEKIELFRALSIEEVQDRSQNSTLSTDNFSNSSE